MPRTHPWKLLACDLHEDDADILLQSMKAVKSSKSQLSARTTCTSVTPHSMRYQLLSCMCTQCKAVASFTKCARHANKITCLEAQTVTLSELVTHLSPAAPRKKPTITRAQRTFIQQMARENLTPLRILHATTREFSKTLQELPELRKVQNAVNHYRRTKLGGNDRYGELAARLVASALMGREEDQDAFTFTARVHRFGKPIVGDGSVVHPFVVGVTTKALLRTAKRDPATFILHVDATFQLDQLEEKHYTDALAALQTVYSKVLPRYVWL
ncbi:hypothetical protein PF004_g23793 [Phytophthora fragariae]|uniref:MULE transposase domain-containing protein n=1 Tax=Phytophthora fragariae TaxID=53985 RepID=A0A6G0MX04_9STRA|nr:hypothetical protein PF004_g23793 [Phytophthora fragariae]